MPETEKLPRVIKARELQLGDVVMRYAANEPVAAYMTSTVKRIEVHDFPLSGKEKWAILFRVYVSTDNPACVYAARNNGTSIICLIGVEEYPVPMKDEEWLLLERIRTK